MFSFFARYFQRINPKLNAAYLEQIYQGNYFELARTTDWMKSTPISSPSGGTASFSLLYVLLAILRDGKFDSIMEIGVGQSTKILLQYQSLHGNNLYLLDDDEFWLSITARGVREGVIANYRKLVEHQVCDKKIQWYDSPEPDRKFQLILIDGPKAYKRAIRYNRLGVLSWIPGVLDDDFIIIVDDSNRVGEALLVREMLIKLDQYNIPVKTRNILGANSQTIIASEKYQKFLYL